MKDSKVRYCNLCFSIIHGENYESFENVTKEILCSLPLKVDFDNKIEHVMCNSCSAKLLAVQNFKTICLSTDNVINSYVDDITVPLDLREIYMEEMKIERISDNIKICRLCMQPINNISECKTINDEQVDMILKFVPGMNIFTIKEPVVCKLCLDSLAFHCNFLTKCCDVKQNIEKFSNEQLPDDPPPVATVDIAVKVEKVDDEFEDVPEFIKTECLDTDYEETGSTRGIHDQEVSVKHMEMYKCEYCYYETKYKHCLQRHAITHKDSSEVQMYKCEICDYETKIERNLKRHTVSHKSTSEVQMYKCEICSYKTKYQFAHKRHTLRHKKPPRVQMYKCQTCSYETKNKKLLRSHMLIHKDPSEVQMHKCENCNYETRYKINLKSHMLKHKDPTEVRMYKCENCDYESKYKTALKRHNMLVHKNRSEGL